MSSKLNTQIFTGEDYILIWVEQFIKSKKSENIAKGTLRYYKDNLWVFTDFLENQEVKFISQITPSLLRDFLLLLEERGHNPGGIHSFYRVVKTFLRWYWEEEEPTYANPINKVKAPRVPVEAIEGISRDDFEKLLDECSNDFLGERDKAVLYTLYDTGVRASELTNILLDDANFIDNSILIRQGKGRKPRYVFFGKATKKQLKRFLRLREDNNPYLFVTRSGEKLIYSSLKEIVRRLAFKADLKGVGLHDFRRAFCLNLLQANVPETTIARLMGHTSLQLISRYAKQKKEDLQISYKSPVDE